MSEPTTELANISPHPSLRDAEPEGTESSVFPAVTLLARVVPSPLRGTGEGLAPHEHLSADGIEIRTSVYLGFCVDVCSLLQKEVDHFHISVVTGHN